jgi:hypothetical protein
MTDPITDPEASGPVAPRVVRPSLCRDVVYTDPQIPGSQRAAKVVGTRDSIAEEEGVPTPSGEMKVHLLVFPPVGSPYGRQDVDYDANGGPGTWRWPTRVEG